VKIDLTESEYRTLLTALEWAASCQDSSPSIRRFRNLRDNLRVRWERAADEQQKKELKERTA
jgi:hypothetical protein